MDQDDAIVGRIFTRRELLGGAAKWGLGLAMPRMLAQSSSTWARRLHGRARRWWQ